MVRNSNELGASPRKPNAAAFSMFVAVVNPATKLARIGGPKHEPGAENSHLPHARPTETAKSCFTRQAEFGCSVWRRRIHAQGYSEMWRRRKTGCILAFQASQRMLLAHTSALQPLVTPRRVQTSSADLAGCPLALRFFSIQGVADAPVALGKAVVTICTEIRTHDDSCISGLSCWRAQ